MTTRRTTTTLSGWTRRIVRVGLATLLGAPCVAADDTAPGRILSVDGHRMHLRCQGRGSPAVILDAGLGGSTADWSLLQPLVGRYTRVCSYDRAGYGFSAPSSETRSSERIARELHRLLDAAGVAAPYVLVGHSFGGFNVRMFAAHHPRDVAGMVLIDASHEDQFERFEREFGVNLAPRRSGNLRLSAPFVPEAIPQPERAVAVRRAFTAASMLAVRNELGAFRLSAQQVRSSGALPPVPLVVLTRGRHGWSTGARGEGMERLWMELQQALLRLSDDGEHIIAKRAGHYVHLDQPELVDGAIERLVRRHRGVDADRTVLAGYAAR